MSMEPRSKSSSKRYHHDEYSRSKRKYKDRKQYDDYYDSDEVYEIKSRNYYDRESRDNRNYVRHRYDGDLCNRDYDKRRCRDDDRRNRRRRSRSRSHSSSYEETKSRRISHGKLSNDRSLRRTLSQERKRNSRSSKSTSPNGTDCKTHSTYNAEAQHVNDLYKNNSIFDDNTESDFDKEKIHEEMQERLRQHLAKEGKIYPPPKQQASHPIFANDGSFLETFKRMHAQHQQQEEEKVYEVERKPTQQPLQFGKRRGGKILKTGIVKKPIVIEEATNDKQPKDAWALYLQEVKKYKNVSCDADSKTRPLWSYEEYMKPNIERGATQEDAIIRIQTAPFDPRFPNTNQTKYCTQSYVDFYRCQKLRGKDYEPCNYFKKVMRICPNAWIEKWDEQQKNGTLPVDI